MRLLEKEKGFRDKNSKTDRVRKADRSKEMVADKWSLVRERALTTGICSEGWCSEHSGVYRRAELPGRSLKMKKF